MRVARMLCALGVVSFLTVAAQPARAAGGCQSEIERFCKGEKAILKCLRKNQADLSPTCTTYLNLFEQLPSCLSDAAKLCPTENPSVNSVVGCLRGQQDKVSAECRSEIEKVR